MIESTLKYAFEMKDFDFFMTRLESLPEKAPLKDSDKAIFLGVSRSTFSTWKSRNKVPYYELLQMCSHLRISMDWFFEGKGSPYLDNKKDNNLQKTTEPKEELFIDMMKKIIPEIERAQLPMSDEILSVMVKTYMNFKDKPGANLPYILRAVAESQRKY
ncbi:MAG: hypothetical protein COB35_04925 [Gammaproteobacteria bacterium]|nr:MAG: hypothetical protein COB35_04925 [Gammaproteobacteria bacterium]